MLHSMESFAFTHISMNDPDDKSKPLELIFECQHPGPNGEPVLEMRKVTTIDRDAAADIGRSLLNAGSALTLAGSMAEAEALAGERKAA